MIAASTFAGRNVAVFGMGISGIAAGRSLIEGGAFICAWDDSEAGREAARCAGLPVADLRDQDWTQFSSLVLAPGVPLTHPEPHWTVCLAQQHSVEIIGDTEIFCRERRAADTTAMLIAITGTNGKSTTTALVHHLLTACGIDAVPGGNIGKAVLDLPTFADNRYYVLEFSSFQLDLTPSLDADAAVLLNITPDHLDRHGSIENYAAVKEKIFTHITAHGVAVIGADDVLCDGVADRLNAKNLMPLRVSSKKTVSDGVYGRDGTLFEMAVGTCENMCSLKGIGSLRGTHNAQNAAAAMAISRSLGLPWPALAQGLRSFPGLPHRMEEVARAGNVVFINDSKATNADAAERALLSFENIYWIAGGKPKAGGIDSLVPHFGRIRKAYLIGEAAPEFAGTLAGKADFSLAATLERAIAEAAAGAARDPAAECIVLLSPACASYDQFPNFEVRGDTFRALAQAIAAQLQRERAA